jgi:hypothetical protein
MSRLRRPVQSELPEGKLGYTSRPTFTSLCHDLTSRALETRDIGDLHLTTINLIGTSTAERHDLHCLTEFRHLFWPTSSTLMGTDGLERRDSSASILQGSYLA